MGKGVRVTREQVRDIRARVAAGEERDEVAKAVGVSVTTVTRYAPRFPRLNTKARRVSPGATGNGGKKFLMLLVVPADRVSTVLTIEGVQMDSIEAMY